MIFNQKNNKPKNKNTTFNLTQKIEILIKKYIKKRKIYLETEEAIVDFDTLKTVNKKNKASFTINLKKIFQDKIIKTKNKPIYKYIYKTKTGEFIGGNILTIALIFEVLKDVYNQTAFILENKNNAIFLLGKNYKIVQKDKEFDRKKEEFFQGIEPPTVNIYDAISLLLPIDTKKILTLLGIVISVIILIGAINLFNNVDNNNEEELNGIPNFNTSISTKKSKLTKEQQKIEFSKKLPKTISSILSTNYFISKLFNNELNNYNMVFIKNIDFQNKEVTYYSFLPLNGFKKNNIFYTKTLKLYPSYQEIYDLFFSIKKILTKSPVECETFLIKNNAKIDYIDDNGIYKILTISEVMSPKKTTNFLANLYGCKTIITGNINFDFRKIKNKVNLKIKLFYQ